GNKASREQMLRTAVATFERALAIDSENADAHHNLHLIYMQLGETQLAQKHLTLHLKYKEDDTIRGLVIGLARQKYPAANHAAEPVVIYSLNRRPDDKVANQ